MKKGTNIFLVVVWLTFCATELLAQFMWISPRPQGNSLWDIQFLNREVGFAVGLGSTLLKTRDGGENWINISGEYVYDIYQQIQMLDEQNGFILSTRYPEGVYFILHTSDGWQSYEEIFRSNNYIREMFWFDENRGWVATSKGLFHTRDGGFSWKQITEGRITQITFADSAHGWMIRGNTLLATQDGGNSWFFIFEFSPFSTITSIQFLDSLKGWCTVWYWDRDDLSEDIFHTTDGGHTWKQLTDLPWGDSAIADFKMINDQVGYALISEKHILYKTMDGGEHWYQCSSIPGASMFDFVDETYGWAAGGWGKVLRTIDGGYLWFTSWYRSLEGGITLQFLDDKTYIAAGRKNILMSLDAGKSWKEIYLDRLISPEGKLQALYFRNAQKGWICWDNSIYATNDSASSFTQQYQAPVFLNDIYFVSDSVGWTVGQSGYVARTKDGGTTWEHITAISSRRNYYAICFFDEQNGWIGGARRLWHTTDGGDTWIRMNQELPLEMTITKIFCKDRHTVYLLGYDSFTGYFFKSENGGSNWIMVNSFPYLRLLDMEIMEDNIILSGDYMSFPVLMYSNNNGRDFTQYTRQLPGSSLKAMAIGAGESQLYLLGEGGELGYLPLSVLGIPGGGGEVPHTVKLHPNYPNPFNNRTAIEFYLPEATRATLVVYNVLGQKVKTLLQGNWEAGWHYTFWDGDTESGQMAPSGVYLYQLSTPLGSQTRKMILMR